MLKKLKKIHIEDRTIAEIQRNIDDYTRQLSINPFLTGNLIKGVVVTTASVRVNHGLDREFQGYIITNKTANANVYRLDGGDPTKEIILDSSATVTVDIWVF